MSIPSADFQKRIAQISDEDLLSALEFSPKTLEAWAQQWPNRAARCLFRDADDLVTSRQLAAESFEPKRQEVLRSAERILQHDIQGWGDVSIQHGPTVDFNADYGESGKYGFHYWVWAKPLIQAFLLTEDQKYLAEFDALFNSWYEQRGCVKGAFDFDVIYYELGLGVRNRTFLEYYCLPFAARSLQTHERMLKTLLGAGRWLFNEESGGYRGGNWQVMGCTGLASIAALLPEFRESAAWADVAIERLTEHLQKDLYADGCHSERVPSSYMLTVYKDIRNVAALTGRQDLNEPLDRMLHWFMQTLPPDEVLPGINDGSRQRMPKRLLAEGSKKFPDARKKSVCLRPSGFTVLRGDGTPNSIYMLVNHGPPFGGHTHKDALAFEMHAHGMPMAIDSGIGRTYDDPLHEPWYVTPAAHNMLEVVGAKLDRDATE
ncbi:MAG TPA: heparinase II/III family protein, partial [Tepidisphaeraceae bacterium]|nr:heparinase II/III family protein [Tepidisphaeraceae bacterium]